MLKNFAVRFVWIALLIAALELLMMSPPHSLRALACIVVCALSLYQAVRLRDV